MDGDGECREWHVSSFHDVQVVDVNRSKQRGRGSGGIGRFSTMVVVGNFQVYTKQ